MLGSAAKMAADVKWCNSCEEMGVKKRLRVMQINLNEAAVLCKNELCKNSSTKILPRRVSKLNITKRKKQRLGLASPPNGGAGPPESPMSPLPIDPNHPHILTSIPGSTNTGTVPSVTPLRTQLWEGKVVQWQNENALCWLDVSMCVLVHCSSLRLCLRRLGEASLLHELCNEFDNAQAAAQRTDCNEQGGKQRTDHDRLRESGIDNPPTLDQYMQYSHQLSLNNHEAAATLEWLVMSDEESAKHREQFQVKKDQASPKQEKPPPSPDSILTNIREKLRKALEEKLGCKLGEEETPVFALPLLSRFSGAVEEHFMTRYRWEFFCKACNHSEVTMCSKSVLSFTQLASDFSLLSPVIIKTCPVCKSPDQRNHLVYHSLPSCLTYHFSKGAPSSDISSYDFKTESSTYEVASIVQYTSNPNHFIAWIRDTHRNMWLKCNDLESSTCEWQSDPPIIPASEIHVIMMERQGEPCDRCSAMNSEMTRITSNIKQAVEKLSILNGRARQVADSAPSVGITPVQKNGKPAINERLPHLWQRRASSFHPYSGVSKPSLAASHVPVFDLDADGNDSKSASGSVDGETVTERNGEDEGGSRSSSPSVEAFSRTRKRSRPNYLLHSVSQTIRSRNSNRKPNGKASVTNDVRDSASNEKLNGFVHTSAADVKLGNSTVYAKRIRSTQQKTGPKRAYYPRKKFYPGYSASQAPKSNNDKPAAEPTLSKSLPEGAFVRFSVWGRRDSAKSLESGSSRSELHLDTKSVSQILKPRCNSLSSVSSPSACSDLSSMSDTLSNAGSNSSKDDLNSTIDELYKALEIGGAATRADSRIPSPTVDDDFLQQLLSDDPVCPGLDNKSVNNSVVVSNGTNSAPSVDRTGQEVDRIVPSIEPMAQDLLAKLVP